MRKLGLLALSPIVVVLGMSATAAFAVDKATNQAAAKAAADRRGELLEGIGDEMDKIGPMVRKPDAFNAATVKASAAKMAELAPGIPGAFATDTRGFRVMTSAKDAIWENYPDFLAKSKALNAALADLKRAAATGQRATVVPEILKVSKACRSCHQSYKTDM